MRIGLIAMSGVRVRNEELARLGLTLPQFVSRGKVIASLPSLGLLTVAGLTPPGHEIVYREVADLHPDLALEPFDLVGISSFTAQIDEAYALADRYRAAGVPVVLGGLHVSLMPDEAAQHADSVVLYGAEGIWPQVVCDAEAYYRAMFRGRASSWNLRDLHMADTLQALSAHLQERGGAPPRMAVWAHNSHLGDAGATSMSEQGEWNVGELMRQRWGDEVFSLGFTTYEGTVRAADEWDEPGHVKRVRPGLPGSWEALFHDAEIARFYVTADCMKDAFGDGTEHLQRAIGVVYRPDTERRHYQHARLADEFDVVALLACAVERAPRDVVIHKLEIRVIDADTVRILASVSKGTYIRTLGEDIGEALGCGAHLSSLRRVATGGFAEAQCVTLEALEAMDEEERLAIDVRKRPQGDLELRVELQDLGFRGHVDRSRHGARASPIGEHDVSRCCEEPWTRIVARDVR